MSTPAAPEAAHAPSTPRERAFADWWRRKLLRQLVPELDRMMAETFKAEARQWHG